MGTLGAGAGLDLCSQVVHQLFRVRVMMLLAREPPFDLTSNLGTLPARIWFRSWPKV